jgi:uncharacterized phage protein (TIGR02220 family)
MARLWRQCTLEQSPFLPAATITRILGERGVHALVESRLGEVTDKGIRIRGTKGRIEWLKKLRNNKKFGKLGGRPKKNPYGFQEKPIGVNPDHEKITPLTLTPSLTPSPVQTDPREDSDTPPAVGPSPGLDALMLKVDAATGDIGRQRARRPKPNDPTAAECESVRVVLAKLSTHNGVRYTQNAEHTRLIVARLRDGASELDLRAVVAYCAFELDWKADPDMQKYLRPETLFGPKTIAKYLDPARTWAEKAYPAEFKNPALAQPEPLLLAGG